MPPREGVRAVDRAVEILRILSFSSSSHGMRFLDLQAQTNLSKATLHRLLGTLMDQRLVEQAAGSRLYYLGLEFLMLGERASNRLDIRAIAKPHLVRIARRVGDTTTLAIRSNTDVVYIDREDGSFPVRAVTATVGTRRPLGVGSSGLALLAALPESEARDIIRRNTPRLRAYPNFSAKSLHEMVESTRRQGYAFNDGNILKGMIGIAVPIGAADARPVAAIAVSGNAERMAPARRRTIVTLLQVASREISEQLAGSR